MKNLTEQQKKILTLLLKSGICEGFYLAGGTAVSIKYNHRYSEDFDFFSDKFFSTKTETVLGKLKDKAQLEVIFFNEDTLIFYLGGIKISFFKYSYKLLKPLKKSPSGLKIASDEDIAAMKAIAIAQRGTKKDFFDLWFLMRKNGWTLKDVSNFCVEKYGEVFPQYHFLKAATYFEDAEKEKSYPEIEKQWKDVKEFFLKETEFVFRKDRELKSERKGEKDSGFDFSP